MSRMIRCCLSKSWKYLKHYRKVQIKRGTNHESFKSNHGDSPLKKFFLYLKFKLRVFSSYIESSLWDGVPYDQSTVVNSYIVKVRRY